MNSNFDILDLLLDGENKDPITLMDESGKPINFEQVAVIPHAVGREKRLYCILRPAEEIEGIALDEAIVFLVDVDDDGNSVLRLEEDDDVAKEVFEKYYDLILKAKPGSVDEIEKFKKKLRSED